MVGIILSRWIGRVRAAERGGDLLLAHDLANRGLVDHPGSVDLRYLATRALARSGATAQAATLYRRYGLDREAALEVAALGARIAKDTALGAKTGRPQQLRAAAGRYAALYRRSGDHYPAVNAATLYLLAGSRAQATRYARLAIEAAGRGRARNRLDAYYRAATAAEGLLILGQIDDARFALRGAAARVGADFDAAATTRKQLRLVCGATGIDLDVLDVLRMPAVVHYYGPASPADGRDAAAVFAATLRERRVGYVYGSLAAGAEIRFAEAALAAGAELHVILPFDRQEFVAANVRRAGRGWLRRFNACLRAARTLTQATSDAFQGDQRLFSYACRLGMGMATLRADYLDATVVHLALQPAGTMPDPEGYGRDLALWQAARRPVSVIGAAGAAAPARRSNGARMRRRVPSRVTRALVFGDVKGFSKVPDALVPVFQRQLMGPIATALRRYGRHVLYRNSWGDAIYAVMDDPVVAADCCLAIQRAIKAVDLRRHGLPAELSLRLAAHFGPVYEIHDPVRDEANFFGAHTTMTARMEPVTMPGQVYVTEAMAASIALAHAPHLRAESVGVIPMAKGYGEMRMYNLSEAVAR